MIYLPNEYSTCGAFLEEAANPSDTLYHYTSFEGLKGILESQRLWLTNFLNLSDVSEIYYALYLIRSYIFNFEKNSKLKLFFDDLFEDILTKISDQLKFFSFSFCMKKNYLYAWRTYGNDGKGFSIGFRKEFFYAGKSAENRIPSFDTITPSFSRGKVFYDFKFLEEQVKNLFFSVQEDLERNFHDKEKRIFIAQCFTIAILRILSSLKHDAYREENEHRIYTSMPKSVPFQNFLDSNGKERVYFEFDLREIIEIWIGPSCDFDDEKMKIERIIYKIKDGREIIKNIRILPSEIPYNNPSWKEMMKKTKLLT